MMATQTPNSGAAQNVIRTNLSSLHNSLRVAQILSVTAGYSQKKKDSVQAVFIQLYADYPNSIGSVQKHPDDIGLVQYSNHVNDIHSVQPLGSIPRDCSSLRRTRLIHVASDVSPSFFISDSSCSLNSCGSRIWYWSVLVLSLDIVITILVLSELCNYNVIAFVLQPKKQNPAVLPTLTGLLTTNDTQIIEVAMNKHITPVTGRNSLTPNIVFTWRFAECQENKATYHHVTAHTEDEARSLLPGLPLVFTARIRQGVNHV